MRDFYLLLARKILSIFSLPFCWGRSPLWFTRSMRPFTLELRSFGFRALSYLDDFLIAPLPAGLHSTMKMCGRDITRIEVLPRNLGLKQNPTKNRIEWFGCSGTPRRCGVNYGNEFLFGLRNVKKVKYLVRNLVEEVRLGRRSVTRKN